eukprot:TRINITY_DN10586_c0_g1_i1.p1 TRINITY_DN10586_c0_g1~~TRINITY_DN10586_c0_g1_i1.p1  ORF type:complete len:269 (-),score=27.54 TRINITY_DN10586_c0_g1_i1:90-896(-)
MKTWLLLCCAFLCFESFWAEECGYMGALPKEHCGEDFDMREIDFSVLKLVWPGTYCSGDSCCAEHGIVKGFVIKSFEPNFYPVPGEANVAECCVSDYVNQDYYDEVAADPGFFSKVDQYWPSLKERNLIDNEFDRCGRCYQYMFADAARYLETVVNVYRRYNLYEILSNMGFAANDYAKYPTAEVYDALAQALEMQPVLICDDDSLLEAHLCVCRDYEHINDPYLIHCPQHLHDEANCGEYIKIPRLPSNLEWVDSEPLRPVKLHEDL